MKQYFGWVLVANLGFTLSAYGGATPSKIVNVVGDAAKSTPGRVILGGAAGSAVLGQPTGQVVGAAAALALDAGPMPDLPPEPNVADLSEQKAAQLRELYQAFTQLNREGSTSGAVRTFLSNAAEILIKYPAHIVIAREYLDRETRPAQRTIFGGLVYLTEPNSQMAQFLTGTLGLTQAHVDRLHQIRDATIARQNAPVSPGVAVSCCVMGGGESTPDEWSPMVEVFMSLL